MIKCTYNIFKLNTFSALQCLSNVPELTDYFLTDEYLHEINEQNALGTQGRLVKAYAELLQEMWSGQASSVRPFKLKVRAIFYFT
jgi:ubiquitin carboxyl-terminal hydrolase 4/11